MRRLSTILAGLIVAGLAMAVPAAAPAAARPTTLALAAAPAAPAAARPLDCQGAVDYAVPAAQSIRVRPTVCVTVGGILRLDNIGTTTLTVTPAALTDCFYAAGDISCRLLRTGSVTFTWTAGGVQQRQIVTVAEALPAPVCVSSGATATVSTTDEFRWWSLCLRAGATLRVEDLGPGLLTITPASAVQCNYAAGVHRCLVVAPGTLDVVADQDGVNKITTVVAIP
jgi:hypothetical protein